MSRYSSSREVCRRASMSSGSSMIEVMLAVVLMALTALGLIAGQLWVAREARAMAMREQAVWIADSVAEAMRTPASSDTATRQWNSRAASLLPHAEVSNGESTGVAFARVTWTSVRDMTDNGEVTDKPESCGGMDAPASTSCIALAFIP